MSVEPGSGATPGSQEPRGWTEGDKALYRFFSLVSLGPSSWSIVEYVLALAGGAGGAWLEYSNSPQTESVTRVAASMIGVIIGAIVGGLAMMTRSFDTQLLKKLRRIGVKPTEFFGPFLSVIFLGVLSGIFLLAISGLPACMATGWRTFLGAVAGILTLATLAALLPAMGSLIAYVDFLEEAAQVRDD